MHPAAQVAWREAAHVGLVGTAGERDPGPRSAWVAASSAPCTHAVQPRRGGDTGPSQGHTRTSCGAGGGTAASRPLPREGRDPASPLGGGTALLGVRGSPMLSARHRGQRPLMTWGCGEPGHPRWQGPPHSPPQGAASSNPSGRRRDLPPRPAPLGPGSRARRVPVPTAMPASSSGGGRMLRKARSRRSGGGGGRPIAAAGSGGGRLRGTRPAEGSAMLLLPAPLCPVAGSHWAPRAPPAAGGDPGPARPAAAGAAPGSPQPGPGGRRPWAGQRQRQAEVARVRPPPEIRGMRRDPPSPPAARSRDSPYRARAVVIAGRVNRAPRHLRRAWEGGGSLDAGATSENTGPGAPRSCPPARPPPVLGLEGCEGPAGAQQGKQNRRPREENSPASG